MKRPRNFYMLPRGPHKMAYFRLQSVFITIVSVLVHFSIIGVICVNGDSVKKTLAGVNSSNNSWKAIDRISVIQGYPRSYHQGYNQSKNSVYLGDSNNLIHKSVSLHGNNQKSQDTPTVGISSSTPSATTVSVMDSWRPITKNTNVAVKISNYKKSIPADAKQLRTNRVIQTASKSQNHDNRELQLPPIKNTSEPTLSKVGKDEDFRKLQVILPLNPKVTHLAKLFARSLAPLFSVVSLWNHKCWSVGFDRGTCYSKKECLIRGGSPGGLCAGGLGVCCVFSYTCDSTTSLNRTYFVNPEFPFSVSKSGTTCQHTITNLDGICQVRLDFEEFHLEGPSPKDGVCWQDSLHFYGVETKLPPLCGDLTGHQVYLSVGFDPSISYTLSLTGERPWRRWKIRTSKIACGSGSIAPGGCLQHYYGPYGRISSFNNADHSSKTNILDLNYGVCVRRERGFCAVRWSKCGHATFHHRGAVDDQKRRRRDTSNLSSKNKLYLSGIDTERLKQMESALSSSQVQRLSLTNGSVSEDDQKELSRPRSLNMDLWRPMIPMTHSSYNDIAESDDGKKLGSNVSSAFSSQSRGMWKDDGSVNVAVKDFLEDLTNALTTSKSKPAGSTKLKGYSFPVAGKKPGKLSGSQGALDKAKNKLFKPGSAFGGGNKKKKPLSSWKLPHKSKKPIFKKKKWNGKKTTKGKNKKKWGKRKKKKGCSKVIPFPFPIALPFPFGGGGGGGGGGGKDDDGWGWTDDNIVFTTDMEPFLIRIVTDKRKENGLAPVCLEWQQISCDDWYANQHHQL